MGEGWTGVKGTGGAGARRSAVDGMGGGERGAAAAAGSRKAHARRRADGAAVSRKVQTLVLLPGSRDNKLHGRLQKAAGGEAPTTPGAKSRSATKKGARARHAAIM